MSKSRAGQKKNGKCGKRVVLSRQLRIKRIQSFVALRLRNCGYVVKKANRRLYALRQLKKCKVPSADIVHIYCALIRSILEYASAVFADLPKYLACYLENVQKRALSIIWHGISYETALGKAALSTLSDRRAVSCIKFIDKVRPGNPLYSLIHNRVVPISTSVCLR